MNFNWLEFLTGILLLESIIYLSFFYSGLSIPTFFGKLKRAALYQSLLMFMISLDIYMYINGISSLINNSMILGICLVYLSYLTFGSQMHSATNARSRKLSVSVSSE